jgi:hypothetical protein
MNKNTWNRIGLMCLMLLLLGGQLHRLPAQHIRIQIKVPPKLALEDTRMLDLARSRTPDGSTLTAMIPVSELLPSATRKT